MVNDKEEQLQIQIQKPAESIEIKEKLLPKNFMVSMPVSSNDFGIICDIFNPEFFVKEMEEYGGKDYLGGICYGLDTHDKAIKEFIRRKTQTRLIDGKSVAFMMDYLTKTKIRLIEPESEKLRLASPKNYPFLHLNKVPDYLSYYIKNRKESDNQDAIHYMFWKDF